MINVLPTELKQQLTWSKRNAHLVRYIWIVTSILAINGAILAATWWSLDRRASDADHEHAAAEATIAGYASVKAKASEANNRLLAAKTIQATRSQFSSLISDLGHDTPAGVFINAITLTGDDKKPVQIAATAGSYNGVAAFRDALAASPRISGADIVDISNPSVGVYKANLTIGFKPGKSR